MLNVTTLTADISHGSRINYYSRVNKEISELLISGNTNIWELVGIKTVSEDIREYKSIWKTESDFIIIRGEKKGSSALKAVTIGFDYWRSPE